MAMVPDKECNIPTLIVSAAWAAMLAAKVTLAAMSFKQSFLMVLILVHKVFWLGGVGGRNFFAPRMGYY